MRIELRDKPEEKKEPVAQVWLERCRGGYLTLFYSVDGGPRDSLLYFDNDDRSLTIFEGDVVKLGLKHELIKE